MYKEGNSIRILFRTVINICARISKVFFLSNFWVVSNLFQYILHYELELIKSVHTLHASLQHRMKHISRVSSHNWRQQVRMNRMWKLENVINIFVVSFEQILDNEFKRNWWMIYWWRGVPNKRLAVLVMMNLTSVEIKCSAHK